MAEWTTRTTTDARPDRVLEVLTDPDAIATWSPIDFDVEDLDGARLTTGNKARVSGSLAGVRVGDRADRQCRRIHAGVGAGLTRPQTSVPETKENRMITLTRNRNGSVAPVAPTPRGVAVVAHEVSHRYGEGDSAVDAIRGVSLDVPTGQFTAVMGPSGSGKSTLMHLLAGLDRPTSGSVEIGGEDITQMSDKQLTLLRRKHVGFVFQAFNLLPMLTAQENVTLPLSIAGTKPDKGWVESVIERVGLTDRRDHRPAELSGGQQQRVAIARALVTESTVLLADEPTGNLDSSTSADVLALLREAVDSYGQTTLMVTHDAHAASMADRVLFLADGSVMEDLDRPDEDQVLAAMKELS